MTTYADPDYLPEPSCDERPRRRTRTCMDMLQGVAGDDSHGPTATMAEQQAQVIDGLTAELNRVEAENTQAAARIATLEWFLRWIHTWVHAISPARLRDKIDKVLG